MSDTEKLPNKYKMLFYLVWITFIDNEVASEIQIFKILFGIQNLLILKVLFFTLMYYSNVKKSKRKTLLSLNSIHFTSGYLFITMNQEHYAVIRQF